MDISLLQILTKAQVRGLLHGIQNAFDEHVRWVCRCQNCLISTEPVDPELLAPDSHERCGFGRWLHGPLPDELNVSEEFVRLGELHKRFHDAAREASRAKLEGTEITVELSESLLTAQSDLLLALNEYLRDVTAGNQLLDPLTGLLNRQEMGKLLSKEKSRAERSGDPVMLAVADLDFFKSVNDRYGHEAGDSVLREAARLFSASLRPYDLLFRMGGEEFLFCFPEADEEEAVRICERMRDSLEKMRVEVGNGKSVSVTVSFGISPLLPGKEVSESLRAADRALYAAKAGGRNRICVG